MLRCRGRRGLKRFLSFCVNNFIAKELIGYYLQGVEIMVLGIMILFWHYDVFWNYDVLVLFCNFDAVLKISVEV